jgi:enoyl-CoA hydratase
MSYENLLLEIQDGIATVTINRPKALNALSKSVLEELLKAFTDIGKNQPEVKGVILTGAGDKAFVAGADIAAMQGMSALDADEFCGLGHSCMRAVETCEVPVLAAVNGFALGGGFELALACDFIYAAKPAKLGLPEVNLGLFPGFGGTQRLARLIGKNRAKELVYTADMISADQAYDLGIVNKVVEADQLMAAANETMKKILSKGPIAVKLAKRVINVGTDLDLASGLQFEQVQFPIIFATEDKNEGVSAFLEKRKANFKGM